MIVFLREILICKKTKKKHAHTHPETTFPESVEGADQLAWLSRERWGCFRGAREARGATPSAFEGSAGPRAAGCRSGGALSSEARPARTCGGCHFRTRTPGPHRRRGWAGGGGAGWRHRGGVGRGAGRRLPPPPSAHSLSRRRDTPATSARCPLVPPRQCGQDCPGFRGPDLSHSGGKRRGSPRRPPLPRTAAESPGPSRR